MQVGAGLVHLMPCSPACHSGRGGHQHRLVGGVFAEVMAALGLEPNSEALAQPIACPCGAT